MIIYLGVVFVEFVEIVVKGLSFGYYGIDFVEWMREVRINGFIIVWVKSY